MISTVLNTEIVAGLLPCRHETDDKTGFGRLLCICGSDNMPGAAVLSCGGALRSGAGLVTIASTQSVCRAVSYAYPGAVLNRLSSADDGGISPSCAQELSFDRYTAVLFGCGIGINEGGRALLRTLLEKCALPLIIDADGLNLLTEDMSLLKKAKCPIILTPHQRELARLLKGARLDSAKELSKIYGITVVSKGAVTEIYGKKNYILDCPNSALAKGGSGDILAGLISGLASQGASPTDAAAAGVFVHSLAGRIAREMHTARATLVTDILDEIGIAFSEIEGEE